MFIQTDRQTDRQTDGQNNTFLCLFHTGLITNNHFYIKTHNRIA
jgi:hypothetical protein